MYSFPQAVESWDAARKGQDPEWEEWYLLGAVEGAVGFERALGVNREVRSIGLNQGPGATFPEMSQAPVLSEVSRTRAGCGESRGHCLQALLELGEHGRVAWVMGL